MINDTLSPVELTSKNLINMPPIAGRELFDRQRI
jgi:hypothetical protein